MAFASSVFMASLNHFSKVLKGSFSRFSNKRLPALYELRSLIEISFSTTFRGIFMYFKIYSNILILVYLDLRSDIVWGNIEEYSKGQLFMRFRTHFGADKPTSKKKYFLELGIYA